MNKTLQVRLLLLINHHRGSTVLICPQEINIQNMNIELVAQMFKNYQSNVLFHLEGPYIHVYLLAVEPMTSALLYG